MMTPSPGWVRALTSMNRAVTTPWVQQIHSDWMSQLCWSFIHWHTAALYSSVGLVYPRIWVSR